MISISDQLQLIPITLDDQEVLYTLMKRIYPPAYSHFWKDQGKWYIDTLYTHKNLKKELLEEGSYYYFIRFRESALSEFDSYIGILKIIENYIYPELPKSPSLKVHRIYLDPAIQGKGIGKKIIKYTEERARKTHHKIIWLDAMDKHPQAMYFYERLGFQKGGLQLLDFDLLHAPYRPMWYLYKKL